MKEASRFTTNALVIKEMTVGESDRLLTLLSEDYGIIRAFAYGAKSIKSKKHMATGMLSYSSMTLIKNKDTFRINEANPIHIFFKAGSDIDTFCLSQYFCEISLVLAPREMPGGEFLRLILNSLHFLSEKTKNPLLIKAITELRAASISGYMPDLVACGECGKFEDNLMYFMPLDGSLYCNSCRPQEDLIAITPSMLSAMRHIVYSQFNNLYSFQLSNESAAALSKLTEKFLSVQTEHHFTTLDIFKQT